MSDTAPDTATPPSSGFTDFVIRRLRYARIQAQLVINHIDSVGVALKTGWLDGEDALACLEESGLLDFVITGAAS
jgi:hypothetical protein